MEKEYIKIMLKLRVLSSQTCLDIIIHEGHGLEHELLFFLICLDNF